MTTTEQVPATEAAVVPPVAAAPSAPAGITLPDNWRETLPDEIKNEPSLKVFNDFNAIVKSLVHAQKNIGTDKVLVPSKHATAEEIKAYYKKSGVPEEKDYKLDLGKDVQIDPKFLENFQKLAAQNAVHPTQAQAILKESLTYLSKVSAEGSAAQKLEADAKMTALKQEWGAAFEQKVGDAKLAFNKLGDENSKKFLDESGFGNHPEIIKLFSKVGAMLAEDPLKGNETPGSNALTPADAQMKANEITMNTQHPYNLRGHPNHGAAVKEVEELYKFIHPELKD